MFMAIFFSKNTCTFAIICCKKFVFLLLLLKRSDKRGRANESIVGWY